MVKVTLSKGLVSSVAKRYTKNDNKRIENRILLDTNNDGSGVAVITNTRSLYITKAESSFKGMPKIIKIDKMLDFIKANKIKASKDGVITFETDDNHDMFCDGFYPDYKKITKETWDMGFDISKDNMDAIVKAECDYLYIEKTNAEELTFYAIIGGLDGYGDDVNYFVVREKLFTIGGLGALADYVNRVIFKKDDLVLLSGEDATLYFDAENTTRRPLEFRYKNGGGVTIMPYFATIPQYYYDVSGELKEYKKFIKLIEKYDAYVAVVDTTKAPNVKNVLGVSESVAILNLDYQDRDVAVKKYYGAELDITILRDIAELVAKRNNSSFDNIGYGFFIVDTFSDDYIDKLRRYIETLAHTTDAVEVDVSDMKDYINFDSGVGASYETIGFKTDADKVLGFSFASSTLKYIFTKELNIDLAGFKKVFGDTKTISVKSLNINFRVSDTIKFIKVGDTIRIISNDTIYNAVDGKSTLGYDAVDKKIKETNIDTKISKNDAPKHLKKFDVVYNDNIGLLYKCELGDSIKALCMVTR